MENIKSINMKLWQQAIPMQQAAMGFAPTQLKERWDIATKKSIPAAMMDTVNNATNATGSTIDFIGTILESAQPIINERNTVSNEAQKILLAHIANKRLLTIAFEAPRTLNSEPVEIPPEFWHHSINWDSGELHAQSLKFIEVRVLHPENAKRIRLTDIPIEIPAPTSAPVGRPSVANDIQDAFNDLLKNGLIDTEAPKVRSHPAIVQWLKANRPNALAGKDTLGDETIRRVILPLFKKQIQ